TLRMDAHERAHLFTLAGTPTRPADAESNALAPNVERILEQLAPFPACAQNARYDLLAYNRVYNQLIVNLDELPFEDRNCLYLAFTHPAWREAVPEWEEAATRMVAQYRAAMAEHVAEPSWKCLVNRLQAASPRFAELWSRHDVAAPVNRPKRFRHPELGLLEFRHTNLWLAPHAGTKIVTYVPMNSTTAERVQLLHERASR